MKMATEAVWLAVGFTGQFLFSMRFIWQWVHSERAKKSVIPVGFWYFSVAGGLTLLSYAIYKRDPVFIMGQSAGLLVYLRNLYLIWTTRRSAAPHVKQDQADPYGKH